MADSSASFSQENDILYDLVDLADLGLPTSSSFSLPTVRNTPALSQAQSTSSEFSPPSYPYELHQQQTDIFEWPDASVDVQAFTQMESETSTTTGPPATIPSMYFSEPLTQNVPPVSNHGMQSTPGRIQVHPGYHQAQAMRQQPAEDPAITNQKRQIARFLDTLKVKPNPAAIKPPPTDSLPHVARLKKDEQQMDEDERLLASEEGKKLNSSQRRQLRNKVSARAFRSRRKEYISQLESEVQKKSYEAELANDHVRRLQKEVDNLRALTMNLLIHDSFKGVLGELEAGFQQAEEAAVEATPAPEMNTTIAPSCIQASSQQGHWGWERPQIDPLARGNVY